MRTIVSILVACTLFILVGYLAYSFPSQGLMIHADSRAFFRIGIISEPALEPE